MNLAVLTSIAAAGFAVAFVHVILPTHWLPFVLVGREQKWSTGKTLGVTALAGVGHVAVTVIIGAIVVAVGMVAAPHLESYFQWVVAAVLVALGLYYLLRESHQHPEKPRRYLSDRAAIAGLILLLAMSPCEAFIGVYIVAIEHGWLGFTLLSVVLLAATASGMMLFTGLMLAGAKLVNLDALQQRESTILGWALILMALVVIVFET